MVQRTHGVRVAALAIVAAGVASAEGTHEAHVHGTSTLDIAIEAGAIVLELRAPGADIVGFEHAAHDDADEQALARAAEFLSAPTTLFAPNAEAGCDFVLSNVELAGAEEGQADTHSEFRASYEAACDSPEKLTTIDLPFFGRFETAQTLEIRVISEKGSFAQDVTRAAPFLDLAGRI